ncbi:SBP domain superfamily [Arabidopsis thaliana x Arabidopsis arenosa]|uniref:SBP domain superfamily n=1 Tax=Arabidopsis thaliana x Arabidopsis arenosa TaxID=1240361 RepID=A0A8T1XK36_9BRAS|nr:SBP domain superfamily [Arabidopsis thaliana x Arabidopsis arenosa]KAG7532949.1 SBP domain superfamily [Arabidopsis thaliana x Arabidopsis arenosa]
MECNAKPSIQWELENLISFGTSSAEIPRKLKPMEWEIDGFDCTSLYSSSFAAVAYGGSSGSDLAHALSKSSKSTSSSSAEVRTHNFTSEAGESLPGELGSSEEFAKGIDTSPSLELSFGSGDPVLGLKLGKRTYFEDFWEVENAKGLGLPVSLASSSVSPVKKSKSIPQRLQTPHCQVEGCNLDLSSAKDYHRKHRICEKHSKFPKVVVSGVERRFCQQCSRFHCLSEFDEKKRSCRRRLSDHNARRRKPNPGRTYDGKPQVDFVWNRFALIHPRSEEKFLWPSSKPVPSRGLMPQPAKTETPNKLFTEHGRFGLLDPKTKTARAELFNKEKVTISSHMGTSQDLDGALSLLSNSTTWVSSDQPRRFTLDHHPTSNLQPVANRSATQLNSVFGYWQPDPPAVEGPTALHRNGVGQFNENCFSLNQFYN